ncbi:MAG: hypothetical protein ACFFE5_10695 [Candidatus Thorarchaeota archaeon]
MSEIMKFYWLSPLIGGFISLIGLAIPVWYAPPPGTELVWIVGLIHHISGGNVIAWAPIEMFIPSIIPTILISLSSSIIIISTIFKSIGKYFLIKPENIWIIMACTGLFSIISYIFGIQYGFYLHTDINFWTIYVVQIGLFIPFIGIGLILSGAIIGKRLNKNEHIIQNT